MSNFAMIFPGQGSQYVGMIKSLYRNFSIVRNIFKKSSEILGYDLWNIINNGPSNLLNSTDKTQPAILSSSFAIFEIWKYKFGKYPKIIAGHSLGEYSALACSGAIDFESSIKLVESRAKFMQNAVCKNFGKMCAIIGLDSEFVSELCIQNSKEHIVSIASYNSSTQVVISGEKSAVENVAKLCKFAGAKKVIFLPISVPSHCLLMKSASEKLKKELNNIIFSTPRIPVLNNVDVKIEYKCNLIKDALIRQLYSPVRWHEIINFMLKRNIKLFLEIGPGNILSSLTKQICKNVNSISINNTLSLERALMSV